MKIKALFAKLFGKKVPPVEPVIAVPQEFFMEHASYEDIAAVQAAGRESMRKWKELHRNLHRDYSSPSDLLGDGVPDDLDWIHKEDMYADLTVLDAIVTDDSEFYLDYIKGKFNSTGEYNTKFVPCSVEPSELCQATFYSPILEIEDGQHCYQVKLGSIFGLLIIPKDVAEDVALRTSGKDVDVNENLYRLQFMVFDPVAVKKADLSTLGSDLIPHFQLNVNFAAYEEPETEQPNGGDASDAVQAHIEKNRHDESVHMDSFRKL